MYLNDVLDIKILFNEIFCCLDNKNVNCISSTFSEVKYM